jgi:hypothetical protein
MPAIPRPPRSQPAAGSTPERGDYVRHQYHRKARHEVSVNRRERGPQHERVEAKVSERPDQTGYSTAMKQDSVGRIDGFRERRDGGSPLRVLAIEPPGVPPLAFTAVQRGAEARSPATIGDPPSHAPRVVAGSLVEHQPPSPDTRNHADQRLELSPSDLLDVRGELTFELGPSGSG